MKDDLLFLDKRNKIPCYAITEKDIEKAKKIYDKHFKSRNTINGRTVYKNRCSRMAGILAEVVFKNLYPECRRSIEDLTYDFFINNLRIDVKCKCRTVIPRIYFEASIFEYQLNPSFNANVYYFMSTTPDFQYMWICGFDTKQKIVNNENSKIWQAGTTDKSNNMFFLENTLCLAYQYLKTLTI